MDVSRNSLYELLLQVFPPEPVPDVNTIFDPSHRHHHPYEEGEIARVFAGKRWDLLTEQDVREHSDWLYYFAPEAFVYYLPAYLCYALDCENADYAAHWVIVTLAHWPIGDYEEQLALLSPSQTGAIGQWFRYLHEAYPEDIEPAIDGSFIASIGTD